METFKTKIKRRILLSSGMILVATALGFYSIYSLNISDDSTMSDGFVSGFQFGLIMLNVNILLTLLTSFDILRS